MATTYWTQWGHAELMAMQGVELDTLYQEECDKDLCQEEELTCCAHGCMDCLGLCWADFM